MNGDSTNEVRKQAPDRSLKWWQWVLMYPTLGIALFGSVPTLVQFFDSWTIGVPFGSTAAAKQQNELWKANFDCTRTVKGETVTTKINTQVSVTVCPSGDVLVSLQPADSPQILRWIGIKSLVERSARFGPGLLLGEAVAAEDKILIAQADTVLCQRLVDGRLLRRVRDANGNCFEEIINTYTGALEKRAPASCSDKC